MSIYNETNSSMIRQLLYKHDFFIVFIILCQCISALVTVKSVQIVYLSVLRVPFFTLIYIAFPSKRAWKQDVWSIGSLGRKFHFTLYEQDKQESVVKGLCVPQFKDKNKLIMKPF